MRLLRAQNKTMGCRRAALRQQFGEGEVAAADIDPALTGFAPDGLLAVAPLPLSIRAGNPT